MSEERKPHLFYWDYGVDALVPVPEDIDISYLGVTLDELDNNEGISMHFRRFDMTDNEIENLPEA